MIQNTLNNFTKSTATLTMCRQIRVLRGDEEIRFLDKVTVNKTSCLGLQEKLYIVEDRSNGL